MLVLLLPKRCDDLVILAAPAPVRLGCGKRDLVQSSRSCLSLQSLLLRGSLRRGIRWSSGLWGFALLVSACWGLLCSLLFVV